MMHVDYANPDDDVPSPIDLRDPTDAKAWATAAESARPGRSEIHAAIAAELAQLSKGCRVLELGPGPGLLAEHVLERCDNIASWFRASVWLSLWSA